MKFSQKFMKFSLLLLCHGAKKSKMTKTQIRGGGGPALNSGSGLQFHRLLAVTQADPEYHSLVTTVRNGFPGDMRFLSPSVKPYWSARHHLTVDRDIVLKGNGSSSRRLSALKFSRIFRPLIKASSDPSLVPDRPCTGRTSQKTTSNMSVPVTPAVSVSRHSRQNRHSTTMLRSCGLSLLVPITFSVRDSTSSCMLTV